jgi:outer membrane receptor protein involved in Fe transport
VDRAFPNGFASLSAGYANGLFEYYNIGSLGDFYLDLQHHYVRGDVAYGPIHLRSFWNSDTGETNSWSAPTEWVRSFRSDIDADTVDVEIEGNQAFETGPMKHRFNMGVGYRFKGTELPGFIPDPVRENHVAAFVQEEATVSRVKVVGSLRADLVHPTLPIGETLSPRGAAIVRVADRTSVRLTGGTAFRAPNHVESYMEWVLPSSSSDAAYVLDYGDVNLNPERIATAEIGVHDESTSYHTADVSLYVNRLQDIIFLRSLESALASDTPIVDYDEGVGGYLAGTTGWSNLEDRYLGYGVEAEAEVFPIDGVDVFGNIAVERLTVSSGEGEPELDESASLVKVNAGASYRTPWRTDVALQANYASPQTWGQRLFDPTGQIVVVETEIPARLILSGRVVVRPLADDALEVGVGAWNFGALLDDDPAVHEGLFDSVQEHPKGQPVGARVFGSVSYRF